ncbi:sprT-like domain-containing protein Spartan [Parambassis ranga]|uniref:DNA-dependent metalloprotease SPRTN n=1 Tax=Parambassis ranga TaxID=210632 RepID=A0A6P7HQG9_9TELE|nr:sprT-like domain-containing protein Spartan [Parambassis ranga]
MDEDLLLAIQLQEEFDHEYQSSLFPSSHFEGNGFGNSSKKRKVDTPGGGSDVVVAPYWKQPAPQPERPLSIVDASWEMLDPSPDVRAMFLEFNDMFFWGKLSGVEVKWSPRMTLCAGVCSYEGRGGLCSIRLSEPLLKLRPRKDLVETLLHEMIHALLFVTQNNRDRDGHGPEFCKHMNRINKASGTNITVYHSFHDEVDVYRQHWWRCDGPCQTRKPYFGYVKRAMNRAPSSLDPWWGDHQRTCGGTYTKVKEPEGYGKKGKKDGKSTERKAIGNGTTAGSGSQDLRNIIPFSGKGFLLGGKSQTFTSSSSPQKARTPTPSSSPVASLSKGLLTPSSPAKNLAGLNIPGNSPAVRPAATSTGKQSPIKRSVSNTRVFVNVNGSPVRIPKSQRSKGLNKITQKSIEELFTSTGQRKSTGQKSSSDTRETKSVPSTSSGSTYPTGSPTPTQSRYFPPDSDAALGTTSRKRSRDGGDVFDLFRKTLGGESAAQRESMRTKLPALQQRTTTATTASSSSAEVQSVASSSSSFTVMVSCPVCQAKVQESKINEHLDSCLS